MTDLVQVYTDGSYNRNNNTATWGFIVIKDKCLYYKERGIIEDKEVLTGFQIGAELEAVIQGIEYCQRSNFKCSIFYDYKGVYHWISDIFGGSKPWRTKKSYTKEYRAFIEENKDTVLAWKWIRGHSGNKWNNYVDEFIGGK